MFGWFLRWTTSNNHIFQHDFISDVFLGGLLDVLFCARTGPILYHLVHPLIAHDPRVKRANGICVPLGARCMKTPKECAGRRTKLYTQDDTEGKWRFHDSEARPAPAPALYHLVPTEEKCQKSIGVRLIKTRA